MLRYLVRTSEVEPVRLVHSPSGRQSFRFPSERPSRAVFSKSLTPPPPSVSSGQFPHAPDCSSRAGGHPLLFQPVLPVPRAPRGPANGSRGRKLWPRAARPARLPPGLSLGQPRRTPLSLRSAPSPCCARGAPLNHAKPCPGRLASPRGRYPAGRPPLCRCGPD